jgi:hypothetical protein
VRTKTQSSLLTGSNSGSSFHFESQPSPSTAVAAGFQLSGVYRVWTITSSGAVTSDATTAILSGIYVGQRVMIVNGDANNKVLKNGANTRFTAGADKTLGSGGAVEMMWTGSIWQEV